MLMRTRSLGLLVALFLTCLVEVTKAGYIHPASVTGASSYNNSALLIIDGYLPVRSTS